MVSSSSRAKSMPSTRGFPESSRRCLCTRPHPRLPSQAPCLHSGSQPAPCLRRLSRPTPVCQPPCCTTDPQLSAHPCLPVPHPKFLCPRASHLLPSTRHLEYRTYRCPGLAPSGRDLRHCSQRRTRTSSCIRSYVFFLCSTYVWQIVNKLYNLHDTHLNEPCIKVVEGRVQSAPVLKPLPHVTCC